MPRRNLIRTDEHPYHVTARSNNKEWFCLPLEEVWEIFCQELASAQKKFRVKIYQFVLMKNHYHMLLGTPHANIDRFMQTLQRNVSLAINRRSERINHLFGGPYRWCLIMSQQYYFNVIRYIFQNPLRAGLVDRLEEYPFSTLHALTAPQGPRLPFKNHFIEIFPNDQVAQLLRYINAPSRRENNLDLIVRKKLKRKIWEA